jgi:hypothetical protein
MPDVANLNENIERVLAGLNAAEQTEHNRKGHTFPVDVWVANPRRKFIAIDVSNSGAFLVERATGELFNISGYGVPNHNTKLKADIGNVATVDPAVLHTKRFNYLR